MAEWAVSTLPVIPGLTAADMQDAHAIIRDEIGADVAYGDTYGRCIAVSRRDKKPICDVHGAWERISYIAEAWTVRHDTAWMRMKTSAQVAADDAAFELDSQLKCRPPFPILEPTYESAESGNPLLAAEAVRKSGKTTKHSAKQALIMKTIRETAPTGRVLITELASEVARHMPLSTNKRGADRRPEFVRKGIEALVATGQLHLQGSNQEYVSLTTAVEVDE